MYKNIRFVKSVYSLKDIPKLKLPSVVLCGRSNVGKSSFINSLFNRTNIAKTSSSPGKTQSINYYNVDDKFYVVDLPGFGYAKVSKKQQDFWGKFIPSYLRKNDDIKLAIHLIDSRHNPTELDIQLNQLLNHLEIPFIVLLSKADKLKQSEKVKAIKQVKEYFPELSLNDNLFFYSSTKGIGKKEIQNRLYKLFYLN